MFLWMNVFTPSENVNVNLCKCKAVNVRHTYWGAAWSKISLQSAAQEKLLRPRYWFTSNHIPFRFSCRPREASRLEAKTHEAEATTPEAEARFFGLEAEARPRGLTSLLKSKNYL